MAPTSIGPYRIIGPLGEGGMGAVYEALHESIERRVALKVLHPEYAHSPEVVNRFFNEARAVNRIEHPNIVQVSEFGQADDGTVYLVMEFLRGATLGQRLGALQEARRRMPAGEAVPIAAQLADALAAAHEKGIVHRDLKPGNVMLVEGGIGGEARVKLLDFGIAKLTQEPRAGGKATKTNALMGTPQYMSPEQCRGAGGVDDRTDVYALGVMLYEMLAGRPPFVAEDTLGYLTQHAYQTPPPLASLAPGTPAELLDIVQRMLVKDKAARPAMREIRAALLAFLPRLSGAGAETLREPVAALRSPLPGPASTLGGSLGQTMRSRPGRRTAILLAIGFGVITTAGLAVRRLMPGSPAATSGNPSNAAMAGPKAPTTAPPALSMPQPIVPALQPPAAQPQVGSPPVNPMPAPTAARQVPVQAAEPVRRAPPLPAGPQPQRPQLPRSTPPVPKLAVPLPAKRPAARFVD